ncbi:beta-propeller fold lactonase family protein [Hydrogenophaga sp. SNF1]|uniref:lactonase family protein n=1 Tax=Hydrogenophaga sp. SNF1 TaxID=3098762 RepID=UPI002ACBF411|nr:beta-propeller fold lactonase family protein [Hydrogenophaga sp. SNF1]WQB85244.1 beta-propeller fold lactonase family protein [Hydrogenophaga sp. SNF1]
MMTMRKAAAAAVFCSLAVAACGGSGSTSSFETPEYRTIPVTVVGLAGTGLVLQRDGSETLSIPLSGSYQFTAQVAVGSTFAVTVAKQPLAPRQTCTVIQGSGTVDGDASFGVTVKCINLTTRFVYATDTGGNELAAFSFDNAGALSLIGTVNNGASSYGAGLTPDGLFLYTANRTPNTLSAYSVDTGTGVLSGVAGAPFAVAGLAPRVLAIAPSGKFLYTATQSGNTIEGYAISQGSGALTLPGSSTATGGQPLDVTITPNGKYLYAAAFNSRSVYGYSIDASTGSLTPVPGSPFPVYDLSTYARSLSMDPRGRFLFVPTYTTSVAAMTIDDATGTLTMVAGSPFGTGGAQASFAASDVSGKFLYVTNENSNSLSAYSVDQTSGQLTPLPGSPFALGFSPQAVAAEPGGQYLLVSLQSSKRIGVYALDADGVPTAVSGSPFSTGSLTPGALAVLAR